MKKITKVSEVAINQEYLTLATKSEGYRIKIIDLKEQIKGYQEIINTLNSKIKLLQKHPIKYFNEKILNDQLKK